MSSQWVQHKSGHGEKWEVVEIKGGTHTWMCKNSPVALQCDDDFDLLYLPKSEYVPCSPPERWVNVTSDCALLTGVEGYPHICYEGHCVYYRNDFRLRKVDLWRSVDKSASVVQAAFIVEKLEREP